MSDTSDPGGRERLLLGKLAAAKERKLTAAALAPKKMTKAYQAAGLADQPAAAAAVDDLVNRGLVARAKEARSVWATLTDAGSAHLASLPPPPEPPPKPAKRPARPPPPDEPENPNLVPFQQAFLLLQLLSAHGRTMTEGKANAALRTAVAREDLELGQRLAQQLRRKLAEQGRVRAVKEGRSLHLTLTDDGLTYLASLRHHPAGTFTVTGTALNDLLDAARGGQGTVRPTGTAAAESGGGQTATPPADLGGAAYAAFRELARERYSRNGLVPIFAIRRELARRYGPGAARHDVLDAPILRLWRQGKVRLVSISDTRGASADELEDAITDAYETLFYMEDADGQPGTR